MDYFFTKYIKHNRILNGLSIILVNLVMFGLKLIRPRFKVESNNVLIISLHRLGDAVFTINAIKKITQHYTNNIYLFCYKETIPIYKIVFRSLYFIEIDRNDYKFRIAKSHVRKRVEQLNPSIIFDFTGNITSVSLFFRSPAKQIVGCNEPYFKGIYTKYVPLRNKPHITDIYLDAISPIISDRSIEKFEYTSEDFREYILIHPFAGYASKEWGLRKYIDLAAFISEKFNCLLVSPPNNIPEDIQAEMRIMGIKMVVTESTDELIAVISHCALFIGNDSGPIHIANLLGKPTFTIYGPTNPDFHKPLIGDNECIINELICSPKKDQKFCFTHGGVFCPSYECMHTLSYETVKLKLVDYIYKLDSTRALFTKN